MLKIKDETQLEVKIFTSRQLMGEGAAVAVAAKLRELLVLQTEVNVVFAAAPSQNEFLAGLIKEELDWQRVNAFHMDEYIGLDESAPQGFGNFLSTRLFNRLPFKSVHYLRGLDYAALLVQFPVDVVCMGIGENGHIAFNDPPVADFKDKETVKVVELDHACRQQQVNDGCFKELAEVPTHALTLTIPAMMIAKFVYIIVPGATKATAVYHTLNRPITETHPSTVLRTHKNAILFLDLDSAKLLDKGTLIV